MTLDQEELQIELIELLNNNRSIENSMKGAIRKMSFLMTQYRSVLDHIGKDLHHRRGLRKRREALSCYDCIEAST